MPDHPLPPIAVALEADPFALFRSWFTEAGVSEPNDPNAMTLATSAPDGRASARMVLLKAIDHGFTFFTNSQSRKGAEMAHNPFAAILFHWKSLRRQIRVEGAIENVKDEDVDTYFASRSRVSRLGAFASNQSRPLADRADLLRRVDELDARYPGDSVPRPRHWQGYRLVPAYFEFWLDMPFRLHDRTAFTRTEFGWKAEKLYP